VRISKYTRHKIPPAFFASSGEFVGDLTGLAWRLPEESKKLAAGGIKGPLLSL
jgi:hypothetical protein